MSVRSDVGVCRHCGSVELVSLLVRVQDDEFVYTCQRCAVQARSGP